MSRWDEDGDAVEGESEGENSEGGDKLDKGEAKLLEAATTGREKVIESSEEGNAVQ